MAHPFAHFAKGWGIGHRPDRFLPHHNKNPNPPTSNYNQTHSMSLETELEAIQTTAAISPLTDRAFLRITGSDATRWLNGMVTNSIQSLQPGEGNYNFLLNAQGRIQGDCTIYHDTDDSFLLATDATQAATIQPLLDHFIIMDDVELTPALTDEQSLLILGPQASGVLHSIDLPAIAPLRIVHADTPHGPVLLLSPSANHFELRAATATIAALAAATGLTPISPKTLEAHRILSATPKYGQDIRDKDLAQETAQTHALHFNKGCYLGQEIVERIRSRGQVHRTFTAFTLTGTLPDLPASLEAAIAGQTRPAGEITSAIKIGGQIHALGYLRREFLTQPLTYPNGSATPKLTTNPLTSQN